MGKLIYFRADGGPSIGSGHVQRCLSIAEALRAGSARAPLRKSAQDLAPLASLHGGSYGEVKSADIQDAASEAEARNAGVECVFLAADDSLAGAIAERGFSLRVLGGDPADLSRELPLLRSLLAFPDTSLLVDTYAATPEYLAALLPLTRLWVMDDFGERVLPCHGIIAYNVYTKNNWYEAHYPAQQKLLGPAYAPLRAEFRGLPPRGVEDPVRRVLVTTGGTDPLGMAGALLSAAMRRPALAPLHYDVVAGAFHPGLAALRRLSEAHPNIEIHVGVTRMANLMTSCDLAVSACGSTLYELCACGTPGAIFAFADNQLPGLDSFAKNGIFLGGGDARRDVEACVTRLLDGLEGLAGDAALRRDMAARMQALVDGEGARRIAGAMLASR